MVKSRFSTLLLAILASFPLFAADGAFQGFRPPAVPLIACDPYFSVWSNTDRLTDDVTKHWTGKPQPINSVVRIDGKPYRLMGAPFQRVPALPQTGVEVLPTRTVYQFAGQGVAVTLTFLTPMLPDDLEVLARPVTYVTWDVKATDRGSHTVAVYFDAAASLAVDNSMQDVNAARYRVAGLEVLRAGSREQPILQKSGDDLRIDWGYLYLAAPQDSGAASAIRVGWEAIEEFAAKGTLPSTDDLDFPRMAGRWSPVLAYTFDLGSVGASGASRFLVAAYDDLFSIEYLHRRMRPYWRRNGAEASDLLKTSLAEYASLKQRCEKFDADLVTDLRRVGGDKYAVLASLAYRQSLAAQKLVADVDGTPYLFPKENFSNGCIATVDVIYPAAPQLALFSTTLLKASLSPVLDYALTGRWKFPFAPHDVGTYPLANGQVYGGGEKTEENQMPVEESANMLVLVAAVTRAEGSPAYAGKYWPLLSRWAAYLKEKGLDPENQLCTDDFAGHLAHNTNLSIKAIVGLGAFAQMADLAGHKEDAAAYSKVAQDFARRWVQMARDGSHFRLTFDRPGTWSQKYNLVWDRLLGLKLFPGEVAAQEIQFYKTKQNRYGLPLDSRENYTKIDWILWTATMADTKADFETFVAPLYDWAKETRSRVPLCDWYHTVEGKQEGFQARSVVGGLFIKMLSDPEAVKRWAHK